MSGLQVVEISSGPGIAVAGALFAGSGLGSVTKFVAGERFGFGGDAAIDEIIAWFDRDKVVLGLDPAVLADAVANADIILTDDKRLLATIRPHVSPRASVVAVLSSLSWPTGAVSDLLVAADTGLMSGNGLPDREPLYGVGNRFAYAAGLYVFCGSLLGPRQIVNGLPILELTIEGITTALADQSFPPVGYSGKGPRRSGRASAPRQPSGFYKCRDGYVNLFINAEREWDRFVVAVGDPRLKDFELFGTEGARVANKEQLNDIIHEWLSQMLRSDVLAIAKQHRIACLPVSSVGEGLEALVECGLNDTWQQRFLPSVASDERPGDQREWTKTAGGHSSFLENLPDRSGRDDSIETVPRRGPLSNLRVVEVTTGWAGPSIGRILAAAGAQVIKVESETKWDAWRGPKTVTVGFNRYPDGSAPEDGRNANALFNAENRGKLSVLVDMQRPQGQDFMRRLIAKSDVLIENLRPGAFEKLGLAHDDLVAINPSLRTLSVRAAGRSDSIVGWASVVESVSGTGALLGYPDDPRPMGSGASVVDPLTGLWGTALLLASFFLESEATHITVSMLESVLACVPEPSISAAWEAKLGNRYPNSHFQGCLRAEGDDSWLVVSCDDARQVDALIDWLEPDGPAPFETHTSGRLTAASEARLRSLLDDVVAEQPAVATVAELRRRGVSAAVVRTYEEAFADGKYREAGIFVPIDHPVAGRRWSPESPLSFTGRHKPRSPLLGEHNAEVWQRIVGLSENEFERACAEGTLR